jgi:hypothetical protein
MDAMGKMVDLKVARGIIARMPKVSFVKFCCTTVQEKNHAANQHPTFDIHVYLCGGCKQLSHARIVARADYEEGNRKGEIVWCLCACGEPTVLKRQTHPTPSQIQFPQALEFKSVKSRPPELQQLFDEGAACFAAGAFTAVAMVCRKRLMVIACKNGAAENLKFAEYVDHIMANVVPIPSARPAIDAIRTIGNEATHEIDFVTEGSARRAIQITQYVLNAVYALPAA